MKVIRQSAWLYEAPRTVRAYEILNDAGRTAHKSESKDFNGDCRFVDRIVNELHHESVIEHVSMSAVLITDRGISHEIVRHRLASFTQESTRYCNYSKDRFGNELTFIEPIEGVEIEWAVAMRCAEKSYFALLAKGQTPQQARAVLPNSLKTEIFMTANLREWRHIFKERCLSKAAHPQMRSLMKPLYDRAKQLYPEVFDMGEAECVIGYPEQPEAS